jgi:hypothetical protein
MCSARMLEIGLRAHGQQISVMCRNCCIANATRTVHTRFLAVENGKSFEELMTEERVVEERFIASDPSNSVHQMWVFDAATMIAVKPKK